MIPVCQTLLSEWPPAIYDKLLYLTDLKQSQAEEWVYSLKPFASGLVISVPYQPQVLPTDSYQPSHTTHFVHSDPLAITLTFTVEACTSCTAPLTLQNIFRQLIRLCQKTLVE